MDPSPPDDVKPTTPTLADTIVKLQSPMRPPPPKPEDAPKTAIPPMPRTPRAATMPTNAVTTAAAPKRMSLDNVTTGAIPKPPRLVVFGQDGVGKSTLGSQAEAPIFLGAEDGTSELRVARMPEPTTWQDALDAIGELTTRPHPYKTFVVDTIDWLEPLCWAEVVARYRTAEGKSVSSFDRIPYGNGYEIAIDYWRALCAKLDRLRDERGMVVILLAHAAVTKFRNPEAGDYERYAIGIHHKAAAVVRQWADAVLFAMFETSTYVDQVSKRTKGVSTGARILRTQYSAAWEAKNRYRLPDPIALDYEALTEGIAIARGGLDASTIRDQIRALLTGTPELTERVEAAITKAGDDAWTLQRIRNRLALQNGGMTR